MTTGFGIPYRVTRQATTPQDNQQSTSDTIAVMRALAIHAASTPSIQAIANQCLDYSLHSHDNSWNHRELVRCAYQWVKGHISFQEDEAIANRLLGLSYDEMNTSAGAIDLVISPEVLVAMDNPVGDCDCFSTLIASILVALQLKCWFVSIKVDRNEPDRWSHVYVQAYLPDENTTVALDASHGTYLGWEKTDGVFERKLWDVN